MEKRAAADPHDKGEGDLLQAMFDDSAAIGEVSGDEESSSVAALDDLQAELEQAALPLDPDFVEDIFAASEMGDHLAKKKAGKEPEAQKKGAAEAGKKAAAADKKGGKAEGAEETAEPNADYLQTLQEMGFSAAVSKQALIKVKNESVAAAVEAAVVLQAEQMGASAKPEPAKVAVTDWSCPVCTLINKPGGSSCPACGGAVPPEACINEAEERAKKEEEDRKKKEEEERIEREKKLEEEVRLQNELKSKQEEEHREQVKVEFEATKQFLEESKVHGFLFSSVKGGRNGVPLLVGAIMSNSSHGVADVHFKSLSYRSAYLENFTRTHSKTGLIENRLTKELFDSEAECLESLYTNHQELLESLYPALGGHQDADLVRNHILQSHDVGVARLPLKDVTWICQLGEDLTPTSSLTVLVQGHKADGSLACFVVAVCLGGPASAEPNQIKIAVSEQPDGFFG